ncbi:hypothetical protein PVA44_05060 [Entomospira nematocerorum]|uniref:Uncharacterized protein n=1 Tax=Entomospira nematocerorum TaxID=2719987 RepID=A0A968KTV8_9SPIO|nr:hypothetical protein [Entomospira nematocera]NIZ46609.1 hypothetical protein [Entomospira nematocera]WDI33593.1 hypothetical protein PVA44_05060 [Entomospira nematocera]
MINKTTIGDGMISIGSELIPIESSRYCEQFFAKTIPFCAVKGCRRKSVGLTKIRLIHQGHMFATSKFYFIPLCNVCYNVKHTHLEDQIWILKDGYPLVPHNEYF